MDPPLFNLFHYSPRLTGVLPSAYRGANIETGRLGVFLRAIDEGRVKPGSYLIIENLDRLSRDTITEAFTLMLEMLKKGIIIVTLFDNRVYTRADMNDPVNMLTAILIMARAHEESATKLTRLSMAWENKRNRIREGHKLTSNIPGWLILVDGQFHVVPEHAQVVNRIYELSCSLGVHVVTKILNTDKVPVWKSGVHKGRVSDGWHPSYIKKILRNTAVIGEFQPYKMIDGRRKPLTPVQDYYPCIVSEELFHRVQKARTERREKGGEVGQQVNIFTHIMKCGRCGGPIIRANNQHTVYMTCDRGRRGVNDCKYKLWKYDELELDVLNETKELQLESFLDGGQQAKVIDDLYNSLCNIDKQLSDCETQIQNIINAIAMGGELLSLVKALDTLEERKKVLIADKENTEKKYKEESGKFAQRL